MARFRHLLSAALVAAAAIGTAAALGALGPSQEPPPDPTQEPSPPGLPPEAVRLVKLTTPLPAIGNVDAVKEWRFGRIQEVERLFQVGVTFF